MKFVRNSVLVIALLILVFAISFSVFQQTFKNSQFEFGTLTEVEGVLHKQPYPMLRVTNKEGGFKNILLIGFGKFGAHSGLKNIEEELGENLEGRLIKLSGTLVYYNGKTLMQLENNTEGTYTALSTNIENRTPVLELGNVKLKGEIIDPKCYFGVMKPGFGKIHRSCAARCLSGGIPPVFVVTNQKGESSYFLLAGEDSNSINQRLLPFVGKPIALNAKMEQLEDWFILRLPKEGGIHVLDGFSSIYTSD